MPTSSKNSGQSTHASGAAAAAKPAKFVDVDGAGAGVGLDAEVLQALRPVIRSVQERTQVRARAHLRRLRAVILLDGAVRRTPLTDALDRSLLELPLAADRVLLDAWRDEVSALVNSLEVGPRPLPCRVVAARNTRLPELREQDRRAGITAEFDPAELRGTGGVLRDLAEAYADDDLLLVANAAQLLVEPLHAVAEQAAERAGDVTVVGDVDGTPASLLLVTCRALRDLPAVGFVDLKEQALPLMAKRYDVRVQRRSSPAGLPIRTPSCYLGALQAYHRIQAGEPARKPAFGERWKCRFSVVEPGAAVAAGAQLHNSVVLRGGRVEANALVADSIVCAGGVVRRREHVLGQLVGSRGRSAIERH